LICVSHNRWFVSRSCTRIIEVTHAGLREFPGGYAEYLEHFGVDHLDREAVERASRDQARGQRRTSVSADDGASWEEKKRLRNRKKQLPKLRADAEAGIAEIERRQKAIQASYAEPGFFESQTPAQITALRTEEQKLAKRLEGLFSEWEALERENAELESI
jgi:ATP-binding cassette subfamily F protein 3